jgi:hypothetical protein
MAATPTFDYLTIVNNGESSMAKYIAKSRSINATYDVSKIESYKGIVDSILLYLSPVKKDLDKGPEPEPGFTGTIPLIKIYSDSITIRTGRNGKRLPELPIRNKSTNQKIKIPFADISETFAAEISQFIIDLDDAVTKA